MRRVLILGGAGLVGSHLALRLLGEGCRVTVADIRQADNIALWYEMARYSQFNYQRHDLTRPLRAECDEIYNLTSSLSIRHKQMEAATLLRREFLCAINALELTRQNRARLLYASSGNIYTSLWSISSRNLQPDDNLLATFAEAKLSVEALHRAYMRQYGCDIRIARLFNIYGTGAPLDERRVVATIIRRALNSENITIYGSGEQTRTFCWAGDVAEAMDIWMQMPQMGDNPVALDIGGHHEISILQLANLIVRLANSASRIVHCSSRRGDHHRKVPDLAPTHHTLGWLPSTSLTDGLELTIGDMRHRMMHGSWVERD